MPAESFEVREEGGLYRVYDTGTGRVLAGCASRTCLGAKDNLDAAVKLARHRDPYLNRLIEESDDSVMVVIAKAILRLRHPEPEKQAEPVQAVTAAPVRRGIRRK